jgi:AcrR family transcriptional regulator
VSRQEQSEKTRSAIIDAAAAAFDEYGYQGAGLSLILEQAGVTRGALYFHFSSKEELAQELIRTQFENIERHLSDGARGLQALINLTFAMAQDLTSDIRVRAGVRLVIEHASFTAPTDDAYRSWIQVTRDLLVEAKRSGELTRGVSPEDAARFLVGAFAGVQLVSDVLNGRADLQDRVADLWGYVLPGLASSPRAWRLRPRRTRAQALPRSTSV